jgi:hypothetical protein
MSDWRKRKEFAEWARKKAKKRKKERLSKAHFEKRFVVLTSFWSMRSGNSGQSFNQFKTRKKAEAWAMKRKKSGESVTGLIEMDVIVGAANLEDEFLEGDWIIRTCGDKCFKITAWDNELSRSWPIDEKGKSHCPDRFRFAHPEEVEDELARRGGLTSLAEQAKDNDE